MKQKSANGIANNLHVLAANVSRLSQLLTREREGLPAAYLRDKGLRSAYLSYFLPSNQRKIHKPLLELSRHPRALLGRETLRILDIGAGPGTASLGALEFFQSREAGPALRITLVDQVAENLKEAEALFSSRRSAYAPGLTLATIQSDISGIELRAQGSYDVVILSNVLNELFIADEQRVDKRAALLSSLLDRFLDNNGSCIIIEPALRETSRDLLAVRDKMQGQGFHVYAPCLSSGACPALVNPKDWCHEEVPWDPPALVQEIDKLTGLRKDALKFSYLVLRKDELSLSPVYGPHAYRVVSEPLSSRGKIEFWLCGRGARKLAIRLDKDESSGNEMFGRLKRGDVAQFEGLADEEKRFKIGKQTTVTVLSLASPC